MFLHDIVVNVLYQVAPVIGLAVGTGLAFIGRQAYVWLSAHAGQQQIRRADGLISVGRDLASLASIGAQVEFAAGDGATRKAAAESYLISMMKEKTGVSLTSAEVEGMIQLGYASAKMALGPNWPKDANDLPAPAPVEAEVVAKK